MSDELGVYLYGSHVGSITPNPRIRKRIEFLVADHDLADNALSEGLSIAPGSRPAADRASALLGGYLPEGTHRIALADRAGVGHDDLYGMLSHYGLTMAGAITVRPPEPRPGDHADYRVLTGRRLTAKIADALAKHDLGNEPTSGRGSIQGFQPKLLLARFDGVWHQPLGGAHSTHIIKPVLRSRPHGIANEAFSHDLAAHMGLAGFDAELITTQGTSFLAIERYDRRVDSSGGVSAIHQEDAAQVLGLDWVNSLAKFQDPMRPNQTGSPSLRKIAAITALLDDGEADTARWLKYVVFNTLVGNTDGHAKNVSILHESDGTTRLADLYDAVPGAHENDARRAEDNERRIGGNIALAVDGEFGFASLSRDHLIAEAMSWDGTLTEQQIIRAVDNTFEDFAIALDQVAAPAEVTPGLRDRLGYNLDRLVSGKPIGKPKAPIRRWPQGKRSAGSTAAGIIRAGDLGATHNRGRFASRIHSDPESRL